MIKKKILTKHKTIGILVLISCSMITLISYYTYGKKYLEIPSDFPIINIKCETKIDSDEEFTDCTFELDSKGLSGDVEPINAKIKLRGISNLRMPKKEYRLKLSDEKELLEMPKENDWLLFAMFKDITHLRIKLSFDLYRELSESDPYADLPDSRYVCLYINGDFEGLYLLAQKCNRRFFDLDDAQNNVNSSLIFQAGTCSTDFKDYNDIMWHQDWPNEYEGYYIMNDIMTELVFFVSNTSDETFFDEKIGVYSRFDKQNLIDFFLYNFFILHKDFWSNNYYLIRNTYPNKFYLIPWDFDRSFGQCLITVYNENENCEQEILDSNYLYYRLLLNENFRQECKKRWFDLRDTILSEEEIVDFVSEYHSEIKDVLYIDSKMWYPKYYGADWEQETVDNKINELYEWISKRLSFCDLYFLNY